MVGGALGLAVIAGGFGVFPVVFDGDGSADVELVASATEQSSEDVAEAVDVLAGVEWGETTTSIGGEVLPSAVWTGSEVLVLRTENGGGDVVGEGWDPATGEATRIADSGLNWRVGAAVAWTGDELLVVGGSNGPGLDQIGAAYDPTSDSWRPLPDPHGEIDAWEDALTGPGVWTGSEMIIWTAGLAYDPESDAWRTIAESPLSERARPTTVWTGTRLLVWGGCQQDGIQCDEANTGLLADGAAYDPLTDTWSMMPSSPLPAAVHLVAAWTGTEAVFSVTEDGQGKAGATALYDPVTERWRSAEDSPLSARRFAASVWAEGRFVVWGGGDGGSDSGFSSGAVFDPAQDRWSPLPDSPGPGRSLHSMVDTGDGIYVSATRTQGPPLILELPDGPNIATLQPGLTTDDDPVSDVIPACGTEMPAVFNVERANGSTPNYAEATEVDESGSLVRSVELDSGQVITFRWPASPRPLRDLTAVVPYFYPGLNFTYETLDDGTVEYDYRISMFDSASQQRVGIDLILSDYDHVETGTAIEQGCEVVEVRYEDEAGVESVFGWDLTREQDSFPIADLAPMVTSSQNVEIAPAEASGCPLAENPNTSESATVGIAFPSPDEALLAFLQTDAAETFISNGFHEMITPDGTRTYGIFFEIPDGGPAVDARFVTLVEVSALSEGWQVTGWTASGC